MNAVSTLKIEKIHTLVTVDDEYRVLHDVDVLEISEVRMLT